MAGNGGAQKGTDEPAMAAVSAIGPGGNNTLTNNDEDDILDRVVAGTPSRAVDNTWNGVEDDSHVQGIYREAGFAGS